MLAQTNVDTFTQELGWKGTFISDVNDVRPRPGCYLRPMCLLVQS